MTTTHASSPAAPKPVESGHKPNQNKARADADKPAATDLFATLLGLVSDTHTPPAAEATDAQPFAQDSGTETDADDTAQNPLTALLAWITPTPGATPAATPGADAGKSAPATDATARVPEDKTTTVRDGVDIEGMTRVDEAAPALPNAAAQPRAAAASRPAFSPLNPHAPTGIARTVDGPSPQGSATAMVWQRGAVSSTEALQQQHAAQHALVRSTVALNERFGFSGAAEIGSPALREMAGPGGSALAQGPAATPNAGQPVSGASAADASGGDHAADTRGDTGASDGQTQAEAGQEPEGPTVSHWGTQHLRHASLRVGGEGAADAIDIQLQLKGQEVDVAFQTDNADARASLRESAGESLADLMQRSGIQLGGVSVGGQGASHSGDAPARAPATGASRTESAGRAGGSADLATRPLPQPRADGSRPLDVFA